jgi:hypothetical protein
MAHRLAVQEKRFLANAEDHAGHSLLHLATVNKAQYVRALLTGVDL